jgi:arylsulfatase A-like enzyme
LTELFYFIEKNHKAARVRSGNFLTELGKVRKRIMIKKIYISVLLLFFLSICSWCISTTQAGSPQGIILISLDTLRADHLSLYGYHRNTSPSIDAFAKESIVFERAVVQAPTTLESHMSIMTSLYPSFHDTWPESFPLAGEHMTLAELLLEGGYRTAAFVDGGYLRGVYGLKQGFGLYDDEGGGIVSILPKVKKWLNDNKSDPFFLFIHSYDIHSPYKPPPPYNRIFHDFTYTGHLFPSTGTLMKVAGNELQLNDEDLRHFIALYDGGIRYTDEKIGEFLSYLSELALIEQSLIIITSDHGEEFKEHGGVLHRQLYYRPELHVPLIIRIPKYPKKQIRLNELVQSIDLLPTILDIAGLHSHPKAQGRSLLPLIKRKKNFLYRFFWRVFHPFRRDSHTSFAENIKDRKYSIIADDYQMIHHTPSRSMQLFNIKVDPLAQNNIAKDHDTRLERLLSEYQETYSGIPGYSEMPHIELDEQTREQLKALGYLDPTESVHHCLGDFDCDGIRDWDDNCHHTPNGPKLGTCANDTMKSCSDSTECGVGDVCHKDQEDTDGDGLGDVCDSGDQ